MYLSSPSTIENNWKVYQVRLGCRRREMVVVEEEEPSRAVTVRVYQPPLPINKSVTALKSTREKRDDRSQKRYRWRGDEREEKRRRTRMRG